MITALLLLTGAGVFGYSHLDHKIDGRYDKQQSQIVELRNYENETREQVNRHEVMLKKLIPNGSGGLEQ